MSIPSSPLDSPAKRCTKCGEPRPREQFRSHPQARDGLQSWCRHCEREYARAKYLADPEAHRENVMQWKAANPEKAREHVRRWRAKNPEYDNAYRDRNRDARRQRDKRWRTANRDKHVLACQEWHAKNPDYHTRYYAANRDKVIATMQARRARMRRAAGWFTDSQLRERWAYYGGRCWICGGIANTIDHVIPLSRGGSNWPANLRPACRPCNSSKGDRPWTTL